MVLIAVKCPHCGSENVKRNGFSPVGAERCKCKNCGKSFQLKYSYNGSNPTVKKNIVTMVMNGSGTRDTARVLKISPDTVTAALRKLDGTFEYVNTAFLNSLAPQDRIEVVLENPFLPGEDIVGDLRDMIGAEMDEMWSWYQNKHNQVWLWWAIDHKTGTPLAFTFGTREHKNLDVLLKLLEPFPIIRFYTDKNYAYIDRIPAEKLVLSKKNTQKIERAHLTLRTRIKRLVRKTICFSKVMEIHIAVVGTFINYFFFGKALPA